MSRCHRRCSRPIGYHRIGALLLSVALAAPLSATFADDGTLPAPLATFEAHYQVSNGTITLGRTTISLQPHPPGWRYASVTEATGLLGLVFSGQAIDATLLARHGEGLHPLHYRHREIDGDDPVDIRFSWADGKALVKGEKETRERALNDSTIDGFSATLRMVRVIAGGADQFEAEALNDEGERETLRFRRVRRESIKVPFGTFDTVRVDRVRQHSDRETITWLAPALHWVPVRIEQRNDGELTGRLNLVDLQGDAAADED